MRKALLVLAVCIFATVSSSFALTGSGTTADPYMVSTAADLASVSNDLAAYYELANDVTAGGTIAGAFTGVFDGSGYTVAVAESLFEWNQGTITDLNVAANITAEGVTGSAIGGIVASNSGTVSGCTVSGSIAAGYGNYVGAIAGETNGLIEWCSTDATISVTDTEFLSALDMDNMTLVGGIAGYAYAGAEIASVDSEAAITVNAQQSAVGGVVGYTANASVTDAIYATGTVSTPYSLFTTQSVGGIAGYALESNLVAVKLDGSASVIGGRLADTGGIAGYADVSAISEATSAGSVMVGYYGYAGGIAGRSSSAVIDSYAAGTVSSMETYGVNAVLGGIIGLAEGTSALTNVHNNALIVDNAGGAYVGTIYGWNASSTEAGAYYNSELAMGNATAGYGDAATATALSIAEMAAQASFTAFNFADVWEMGASFPVLQSEPVLGDTPGAVQTRFEYTLKKGYNWISFPILPEDATLTTVIAEYTAQATNLDQINSASGKLAQYYGGTWYGTLSTIEAGKMYTFKVNSSTGVTFGVDGLPVDENTAIALVSGWNWIGSTLQEDIAIADAFSNLNLTNLDQVNSPDGKIAQYYNGAWYGSLTMIEPGVGYKIKVSEAQEFFFDGALAAGAKKAASDLLAATTAPNWGDPVTDQYMMSLYCYVTLGGSPIATADGSVLTVWTPSGVLAGYFTPSPGPIQATQFSGVLFNSETSEAGMTFKLYDAATEKYYVINETLTFEDEGALGSLLFPYEFGDVTEMPSYTVTFDAGVNGSITSGDAVQTVYEDQDATAPTVNADSGWEFTGWDVAYTHITQDTTVTAQYQAAQVTTYTVTFDAGANGSITAGDAVQVVNEGASATAPTVTAAFGYVFAGWDAPFDNITSNVTINALYDIATYRVEFVAGENGSITAGTVVQTISHGQAATAPTVTPNAGYNFTGWDTDFSSVTSDLTVTAQYSVATYTVTFVAGENGSITAGEATQTIAYGNPAVAPTVQANSGWHFDGWDIDFSNVTSDLIVTAVFSPLVGQYQVTFVAGEHGRITSGDAVQTIIEGNDAVAPTVTSNEGFTFVGWDTDFTNVKSNLTVTAQYSAEQYTVLFQAGAHGAIVAGNASQIVEHGSAATAPTITADTGWIFTGWDVAFDNVTSDLTVTAMYSAVPQYTVTFNAGENGTVLSGASQTVYDGEGVELPMLVPDNGYEFMGWFDGPLQYQASDFDSITEDITVTAGYQAAGAPDKYSADFDNDRYIGSADLGVIANSWLYAQDTLAADTKASAFTGDVFGDIDGNKWVGLGDYGVFGQYWLQTIAEQFTYNLKAGYNWISFNLLPPDNGINNVFAGLSATDGDTISSQSDGYATYYDGSWWGNLSTIKAAEKYVLKLASATEFTASGDAVSEDTAIRLESGWNWIGFTPQTAMGLADAFATLTLFDGDQVKSSAGEIAEYYQGQWYGTLDTLEPGAGYRIKISLPQTFAYSGTPAPQVAAAAPTTWVAPVGKEFSMTLFAEIQDNLGNQIATADGSMLSAWASNGDILGVVSEVTAGPTGSLFAMTIWNDADDSSEVVLRAYDAATGKYYNVNDTVVFVDGGVEGSVFAPTVFASLEEGTGGGGIPTWIAPVGTEFSMTLYAQVEDELGAQIATADGSILSAWNSTGAIAGVVSEVTTGPFGRLFAMTIFGDATPASGYTLKVYDAATDKTYDLNASINFVDGDVLGSVAAPQVYTVTGESNGGAPSWVAPTGSEFSMTLYAQVEDSLGAQIATADGSMLSAWSTTGAIAGVVSEVTTGPFGQLFAMTIFGDATPASGYTLKVYDAATDTTYDLNASINFVDGDVLGSVAAPRVYTVSGTGGEAPGWTAPTGLEFSMSMYVQINDQLGAQIATASGSMLSAWNATGTIAGVVNEVTDGPNGKLFALTVFSRNASASNFKLKVFDGATGTVYDIDEKFNFADGTIIGSVAVPQIYGATGTSTGGGEPVWIAPTGKQYSMTLYAEIQDDQGNRIATADGSKFSAWTSNGKIAGVVDEVTDGPNGKLFAITVWDDVTPDTGIVLKTYDAAVDTVYTIDTTIDFADGDVLGSVFTPMVFSATAGDTAITAPDWTHPTGLELYMLVYAQVVDQNGTPVATTSGSMLSAWTLDGSCSGVVNDVTQGPNGYYFNMLIASNESPVEQMRFKVYDSATGMVYNVIETIDFIDGTSVGELWNPQEYTLTVMNYYVVNFNAGAHGTITAGDTAMWVEEGSAATAPTITPDSGYAFDSWDAPLTNVQSDMTITAQYTLASYIVLFDAGDHGTITAGSALQSVPFGFPATAPTVTPDSGYTFAGWDVVFDNITSDLTVTAQYTSVFQDGSEMAPWLIYDANDWKNKLLAPGNAGDNFTVTGTVDLTGAAIADIVLTEPFTGTISGGGTIKYSLDGTGLDYVALIPVANGATITNLTFDVTVTGNNVVAGVIAYSADSLLNNVTVTGTITGTKYVGSLVGENRGTIRNCTSSAAVTGTEAVGGLVGTNRGLIEGSTFTGTITAPAAARYVGELSGANISGNIK
ncbi:MAG: InlB B-repeat-containing protein [Phycisphaerae bacterium]